MTGRWISGGHNGRLRPSAHALSNQSVDNKLLLWRANSLCTSSTDSYLQIMLSIRAGYLPTVLFLSIDTLFFTLFILFIYLFVIEWFEYWAMSHTHGARFVMLSLPAVAQFAEVYRTITANKNKKAGLPWDAICHHVSPQHHAVQ